MNEIRIEGEIGSWTRWQVLDQLKNLKGKPVTLKIASYGGDIAAAIAISHAIQDHGDVTVIHDSLNASAATWLPFGAKQIKMHEDCMLYVHCSSMEVFMWQQMNAEQLKELGDDLDSDVKTLETMDKMIANKYAKHSNGKYTQDQMLQLMASHVWLTAQECLDYGFVDEIIPEASGKKVTNSLAKQFKNCAIPMPEGVEIEKSLLQRIAEKLGIIEPEEVTNKVKVSELPPPPEKMNNEVNEEEKTVDTQSISTPDMNNNFKNVNALLNVEGIEQSAEGALLLTEEQFQAIEDKLTSLQDMETQLTAANEAKQTAENNLKVVTDSLDTLSEDIKAIDTVENKCAKIKEMFDKVPAVPTPAPKEVEDQYADIRIDPINFYAEE